MTKKRLGIAKALVKFGLFEKSTKFEKTFHLKLELWSNVKFKVEDFFKF